jgi:hypothetical protein
MITPYVYERSITLSTYIKTLIHYKKQEVE